MSARMGSPARTRVLLLDSNSPPEPEVVAALRSEGCEIILADDCRHALDITRTGQVDVLVLDFDIHARGFSQLASKFVSAEGRCRTLVLTGSLEQLTLASETGADGVPVRPLDLKQLRIVFEYLLAGRRTQPLPERWHFDTAPLSEAAPYQRKWGINE